jgi:UDPglucose 6-dehydrogenase
VLGLTFKPNTDDMRDSPAIAVIRALQDAGATVHATDPEGIEQARLVLEDVTYFNDPYEAIAGADAIAIVTEWNAYRALDLARVRTLLTAPVFVDLRNIYTPDEVTGAGLAYYGVGR